MKYCRFKRHETQNLKTIQFIYDLFIKIIIKKKQLNFFVNFLYFLSLMKFSEPHGINNHIQAILTSN